LAQRPVPLRILVVEDEALIAEMVKGMLDDLGCKCLGPIADLELALAAARADSYDAAILNLVIEGENAYAVAEVVAERGLPFTFASGVPQSSIDLRWRDRPYLAKPYLMEDIKRWLERLRPPDGD
jgi:DNA-binding response OmpR family regulator